MSVLHVSHNASVQIVSKLGNSSGTGFMVGDLLVLTCFHVISRTQIDSNHAVRGFVFSDIKVTMPLGEIIEADVVSIPTPKSSAPIDYDFAFLKLRHRPMTAFQVLHLATDKDLQLIDIGDEVAFSGYPLSAPTMLTHKGTVSGISQDQQIICIQAPVNKGNSGGALLNSSGQAIGIVSLREGGITQGLANLRSQLEVPRNGVSIELLGLDPLSSTKMLIDTLDQYISVGIGYARSIRFSRIYLENHPEFIK